MKADFAGWATKVGLECTDGRTIMDGAFKHQDGQRVPLVWSHNHNSPEHVLGYAVLHHKEGEGVWTEAYFNDTPNGIASKKMVQHGDVTKLSIWANQLVERAKQVYNGRIKEVSLVLNGANPGATIQHVTLQHSDGTEMDLDDEAIITTGIDILAHSDEPTVKVLTPAEPAQPVTPKPTKPAEPQQPAAPAPANPTPVTPQEPNMDTPDPTLQHADEDTTVKDVYDSFTPVQKNVVHFMIGAALEAADVEHSDPEGMYMAHNNIFEQNGLAPEAGPHLSHDDMKSLIATVKQTGSVKDSFLAHAAEYGIEDIDVLFPDAQVTSNSPEVISRRMEWVNVVLQGTKHSPMARIKTIVADITADEARAKGYVKGNFKKDEIIKMLKRVTSPKTIYKKQKLDRDDILDITDLDIVVWLKQEMRVMLDEELARAILIGDGRDEDDEDKIDADSIRPIAYDIDMYSHKVNLASNVSPGDITEAMIRSMNYYKGSGAPVFFTTQGQMTDLLLQKDKIGRRLYASIADLAAELQVSRIVPVEAMEQHPDLIGVIVNLNDYTVGTNRGGDVTFFSDFDIDYNQEKYLLETRVSGALTRPKSAVVIKKAVGTSVVPTTPSYNGTTHVLTVPTVPGVKYYIDDEEVTGNVTITETTDIEARPTNGYYFPPNTDSNWTYIYTP